MTANDSVIVAAIQDNSFRKIMYPREKFGNSLDFEYVYITCEDEYNEILKLRHQAYSLAGKTPQGATYLDMKDQFDRDAVIVAAKSRGEIAGSVRIMFPNSGTMTEHGRFVEYPKEFPPVVQVAEVSRLCVAPKFSGGGIIYGLMTSMFIPALTNGRRYIFSGAAGKLLNFYEKCGGQRTGIKYQNTDLAGLVHELMLWDIFDLVTAKNIDAKHWKKLLSKILAFIVENKFFPLNEQELSKIEEYKNLGLLKT